MFENRTSLIADSGVTGLGSESIGSHYLPNRPAARAWRGLRRREVPRRFIARFHTKYQQTEGCWLWLAGKYPGGYGMVNLGRDARGRQHTEYAHRVAYVLTAGDIPAGAVVMHACDTPACVNPAHLSLGSQGDNNRDMARKGRHCKARPWLRKLSSADVAAIRASTDKGARLAERYGVAKSTISLIRRGLRRKAA